MPFGVGPLELIIVLVIVLVIFGPKRLPGLGRSLGSGMREFKDSIAGKDDAEPEPKAPADPERIEGTAPPSAAKAGGEAPARGDGEPGAARGDGEAVEEQVSGERRG